MEQHHRYELDAARIAEIKRLVGQCVPDIKSSHRAEAIARGLRYGSNAALITALTPTGKITAQPDRLAFEAFLEERGTSPETLQIDLLYDSVILSCGPWRNRWPSQPDPKDLGATKRRCLLCAYDFPSER